MVQKSLYITPSIQQFLGMAYNPREPDRKGIILAGKGDDERWYANTGLLKREFFDEENDTAMRKFLMDNYAQKYEDRKVVPWMQFPNREYDSGIAGILPDSLIEVKDIIILKPTPLVGKKNFVIDYFSREERSWEQGALEVVLRINRAAEMKITQMMRDLTAILRAAERELKKEN